MPFSRGRSLLFIPAPLLLLLCACSGGGGSTHNPSPPTSNIDLEVTNFAVSPPAADPEDVLTVSGTIRNLGTETANPDQGDTFLLGFNLSKDGTFELNEQGFLQEEIDVPIPPGGSYDFNFTGSYSHGDTLSLYSDFCTGDFGGECVPPETGVIGVRADFANDIGEVNEGNNFQFMPIEIVGTRVGITSSFCDFGLLGGPDGCDIRVSDGFTQIVLHRPSTDPSNQVLYLNELQRTVWVSFTIVNCWAAQSQGGSCGGSVTVVGTTQKPGLPASIETLYLPCRADYPSTTVFCAQAFEIRDPAY